MTDTEEKTAPKSQGLIAYEGFQAEIKNRADELASQLPSNVSRDRFINAAIAAVKQTPDILKATPRSLFSALTKAAQDGLVPDGREGVITVYNQKVAVKGQSDRWEAVAQWNPMTYGLRKRARELDGIIIDTQVVYANDHFERDQGDDPKIIHKPAPLGEDSGPGIGAYAIFKHPTEGILHREVMSKADIETARNQSKAKESLMWTKFWTEGWRKTVARRGIKSVPVSPALERLVQREDDTFDFNNGARDVTPKMIDPPEPPPPPDAQIEDQSHDVAGPADNLDTVEDILADLEAALGADSIQSEAELEHVWDGQQPETYLSGDDDALTRAFEIKKLALARVNRESAERNGQSSLLPDDDFPGDRK